MTASACLVISPPEFEERQRTPPVLLATAADPPLEQVIIVDDPDQPVTFAAAVRSEDAGEEVQLGLYINHGTPRVDRRPYQRARTDFQPVPAGTLDDAPRPVLLEWFPDQDPVSHGCHTITMMATHVLGFHQCPRDAEDSSQLVWTIARCFPGEPCPPPMDCPVPTTSCAAFVAELESGGAP